MKLFCGSALKSRRESADIRFRNMNFLLRTSITAVMAASPMVAAAPLSKGGSPAPIPAFFAENRGQADPDVRFLMKRSGVTAYFRERDVQVFTAGQSITI